MLRFIGNASRYLFVHDSVVSNVAHFEMSLKCGSKFPDLPDRVTVS